MTIADHLQRTNKFMIGFDLVLGLGALLAPTATLRMLGHDEPSPDAEQLFRRCGPIWLTFAAAHATAASRGADRDWWALAWLRGTEIATDALWSRSSAVSRPGAKLAMWGAASRTCRWRSASPGWRARASGRPYWALKSASSATLALVRAAASFVIHTR